MAVLESAAPAEPNRRDAQGRYHSLTVAFDRVNHDYFSGTLLCPGLTWCRMRATRKLGQYDALRDLITLNAALDAPSVPEYVIDYVLYHELLHKTLGTQRVNGRRRVHTPEFRKAERQFRHFKEARTFIAHIPSSPDSTDWSQHPCPINPKNLGYRRLTAHLRLQIAGKRALLQVELMSTAIPGTPLSTMWSRVAPASASWPGARKSPRPSGAPSRTGPTGGSQCPALETTVPAS